MSLLSKLRKAISGEKSEWQLRTKHADDYFNQWAKRYEIADCLDYYTGRQWRELAPANYKPYVVNLVYSTLKVKRPSLLFEKPIFHILPKPSPNFMEFNFEGSAKTAAIKQDALNSWVSDNKNYVAFEVKQAIVDAFFGFGILETGYSANFLENPELQKPGYNDGDDPDKVTSEPEEALENEKIYVRRIPFAQFRFGGMDSPIIERNNWVGYWEFVDRRDLLNAPGYEYSSNNYSGNRSSEIDSMEMPFGFNGNLEAIKEYLKQGDMVKVWKLWDFRSKNFLVYVEDQDDIIFAEEFKQHPFSRIAFDESFYGAYPIPPVSQWLSAQDEVNECSEQLRVHRRRANRKYIVRDDVDDNEFQKMLNGPDGTYMKTDQPIDSIVFPVPQAPMDNANAQAFIQSKDNFNVVSQTNSAMRGEVDRQTATAASISNSQAQITDSEPKIQVATFLVDVGEKLLDKLAITTIPFWIKRGMQNQPMATSAKQAPQFDLVSGEDLVGDDHQVNVMVSSLSPIDNQVELQSFQTFMGLLNANPEFSLSPTIIRELAARCNYTNEDVIEELQKIATLKMMGMQMQGQQQGGAPQDQGANGMAESGNNSVQNQGGATGEAIQNQLEGQVG
jgi:hypothetical protein